MIWTIYFIVLMYFLIGGIGFYFINRKKSFEAASQNRQKFKTYFLIINAIYLSIAICPLIFRCLSFFIVFIGFYELFKLFKQSGFIHKVCFLKAIYIFIIFSLCFYLFGKQDKELLLFTFLIVSIFDSFSQITGQLWGSKKVFPKISPNKTWGGLIGGTTVSLISSFLLYDLTLRPMQETLFLSIGIVVFSFAGDTLASLYKRKYRVKNFSEIIPGHGGILDRFDSLIAGGAWVALSVCVLGF